MIDFILEVPLNEEIASLADLFIKKPVFSQYYNTDGFEFIAWGDPILDENFVERIENNSDAKFIVDNANGHYYYLIRNKQKKCLLAGNSLFSILPIYYWEGQNKVILSADALQLGEYINKKSLSRRFVLETMLFNYPLFDKSVIAGVNLLPSNSAIAFGSGKWMIEKHTHIEDYFEAIPRSWRHSVNEISDVFLQAVKKYLPDPFYVNALTGGFDGRTLTAAGMFHKKTFACYSFGAPSAMDTLIASKLAAAAKIPFIQVDLDDEYAKNISLECGLEFIRNASGTATFARAHYLHAAKSLANRTEYIVTGNFGSEILRAAHVPGVVIAANLYNLFNASSLNDAFLAIDASDEFNCLNKANFKKEWQELKEDLSRLPCFNPKYKTLSQNQKFYVIVFEEVFRKYFGAEMVNQFKYLKNRTPFLDLNFLKTIFKTGLAGIHSGFFEHNPLKRFKGQVLYAHIIKKAYPAFCGMMTDKGYRPNDLLSPKGKLKIVQGYARKLLQRNNLTSDPYGVVNAYAANREYFGRIAIDTGLFSADRIKKEVFGKANEICFKPLSMSYLQTQILK